MRTTCCDQGSFLHTVPQLFNEERTLIGVLMVRASDIHIVGRSDRQCPLGQDRGPHPPESLLDLHLQHHRHPHRSRGALPDQRFHFGPDGRGRSDGLEQRERGEQYLEVKVGRVGVGSVYPVRGRRVGVPRSQRTTPRARVGLSAIVAWARRVLLRLRWLPAVASSLAQHLRFTCDKLSLPSLTQCATIEHIRDLGVHFAPASCIWSG